jgi:hypothetical protein
VFWVATLLARYLRGCTRVTDTGVVALAEHCPELTEINLGRCHDITDVAVAALARQCPRLRKVYLDGCSVTDAALHSLAAGCIELTALTIEVIITPDDCSSDRLLFHLRSRLCTHARARTHAHTHTRTHARARTHTHTHTHARTHARTRHRDARI